MSFILIVVCGIIVASVNADGSVPVKEVYVQRRNLRICPPGAVSADIFEFRRDFFNGTAWQERRTIVNCNCSATEALPVGEQYIINESASHQEVLCQPYFTFNRCTSDDIARVIRYNVVDFGRRTYEEIMCICPRHREPIFERQRATKLNYKGYQNHFYTCEMTTV